MEMDVINPWHKLGVEERGKEVWGTGGRFDPVIVGSERTV